MNRTGSLAALLIIGCSSVPTPMVDAGTRNAGVVDAGIPDSGIPVVDSGMPVDAGDGWVNLFNGTDFSNWTIWLTGAGLDDDPRHVFSIVQRDGEPAIRVSGEIWGALTTKRTDYSRFELEAEYQWGTALYPPLNFRDSGLMYLSTRDFGAVNAGGNTLSNPIGSGGFMVSMEFQIATNDVGNIYNLGPISHVDTAFTPVAEVDAGWNTARIVVGDGTVEHWHNGVRVKSGTGFTLNWPNEAPVALTQGRIQVQCEGAEIYFRRLRIREH